MKQIFVFISLLILFGCKEENNMLTANGKLEKPDTLKTINSLAKISDNLYEMTFHGDYSEILDQVNSRFLGTSYGANTEGNTPEYHCSLFSVFGNPEKKIFGRSFDNPAGWKCLTMLVRTNPSDGFSSMTFVRMRDFGYEPGTDVTTLPYEQKLNLLEAPFHCPDGINEMGVTAGLANVRSLPLESEAGKKSIWITLLVREIMDHAANVDEAIEIAEKYNICCPDLNNLGIHTLVADPSGKSAVLELSDGKIKAVINNAPWQVITNSPVVGVSVDQQKSACPRFNYIYNSLESVQGNAGIIDATNILKNVGWSSTEWSAIYNMDEKTITVYVDYNFDDEYFFYLSDTD